MTAADSDGTVAASKRRTHDFLWAATPWKPRVPRPLRTGPSGWIPDAAIVVISLAVGALVWVLAWRLAAFSALGISGSGAAKNCRVPGKSGHYDYGCVYLHSRTVWVAAAGVAWSVFWYLWSVRHLPGMLDSAARVLEPSYRVVVSRWAERLEAIPVFWTLTGATVCGGYLVLITHEGWKRRGLPFVDERWVTGTHLDRKTLVLAIWAAAAMLAVIPNVVGVVKYALLITEQAEDVGASRTPMAVAREGHRRAAMFGIVTGVAWTVAVVGVVWLAVKPVEFDLGAAAMMAVLGLFGFSLVFVPEMILDRSLRRTRARLIEDAVASYRANLSGDVSRARAREVLERELERLNREPTWVFGRNSLGATALVVQLVLPLVTFVLSTLLRHDG